MKYLLLTAMALTIALGGLIGCGSGSDDVVAVVDDDEISIALLDNYFQKIGYQFESPEEEFKLKREALDSLIDYKLLVKGGYAAGLAADQQLERLMIAERPKFLFNALYAQEVGNKIEVTDKDVEEFYNKLGTEREVSHILVPTKEKADSVYSALLGGASFDEMARRVSVDYTTSVNGGYVGFITWATNVLPEFRDAAFSLPVGELSKPFESDNGWHLLKVTNERKRDLQSKKDMFPFIRQTLRTRRATMAERQFIAKLKEKADVQINPEATAMLLEKLDVFYPDSLSGVPRPDNYFPQLELLEPYEQQMVFASYAGGELSVEEYISKIEEVPDAYRPHFNNTEGLKELIFQIELNNIVEFEADNQKLESSDDYQQSLENFRDGLVAEKFRRDILGSNVDVTEDEIIEYYNSNLEEFTVPAQYHLLEIEQTSMADAQKVIDELNQGADFSKLASSKSTRTGMQSAKGDLGFVSESRFPELCKAAAKLEVNQWSEPVVNSGGHYSVIKLLEVKPKSVLSLEQVQNRVRQEIIDLRRASAALDWLRQAREDAKIVIHEDVIENSIKTERKSEQS